MAGAGPCVAVLTLLGCSHRAPSLAVAPSLRSAPYGSPGGRRAVCRARVRVPRACQALRLVPLMVPQPLAANERGARSALSTATHANPRCAVCRVPFNDARPGDEAKAKRVAPGPVSVRGAYFDPLSARDKRAFGLRHWSCVAAVSPAGRRRAASCGTGDQRWSP